MTRRTLVGAFAQTATVLLLTAVGLAVSVGHRLARIGEPFYYQSDGLFYAFIIKTVQEQGWYFGFSDRIGAPLGADLLDFPIPEVSNILLIRIISAFSDNWAIVYNVFYLTTFFLSALTAFWVLRKLGSRMAWATVGALAFTFLPYHFLRVAHLLLANYSAVPLAVWLCVEAWKRGLQRTEETAAQVKWMTWPELICCILVATSGVYYAFFACMFLSASAAAAAIAAKRMRAAIPALLFVIVISATMALSLAPNAWHRLAEGPNLQAPNRIAADSEVYGLKIAQLLLPTSTHVLEVARKAADFYNTSAPLVNENATASLGVVAGIGFLLGLILMIRRLVAREGAPGLREHLGYLNLVAVLYATIGGFGALFAFAISPQMRALNRISPYIAFISVAMLILTLQSATIGSRLPIRHRRWIGMALVAAIATVGAIDQLLGEKDKIWSPPGLQTSDRDFVHRIEAALPRATTILQLPYHPMPEGGARQQMGDYDQLVGFLYSSNLRWSFGGMKGRPGDIWYRTLDRKPTEDQVRIAALSGFGGIFINRKGYADRGAEVEGVLRRLLGPPLMVSLDGNLALYRLEPAGDRPPSLDELSAMDWTTGAPAGFPRPDRRSRVAKCSIDQLNDAPAKRSNDLGKERELKVEGWAATIERGKGPDRIAMAFENDRGEKTYTLARAGLDRTDVAKLYGMPSLSGSGFDLFATMRRFAPGRYRITAELDYGGELDICDTGVAVNISR